MSSIVIPLHLDICIKDITISKISNTTAAKQKSQNGQKGVFLVYYTWLLVPMTGTQIIQVAQSYRTLWSRWTKLTKKSHFILNKSGTFHHIVVIHYNVSESYKFEDCPLILSSWSLTKNCLNPASPKALSCPAWSRPGPEAADPSMGLISCLCCCRVRRVRPPVTIQIIPTTGLFFWRKREGRKVHWGWK